MKALDKQISNLPVVIFVTRVLNHDLPQINSVYYCACALYFLSYVTSEPPSILLIRHRVIITSSIMEQVIFILFSIQIVHKNEL